MLLRAVTDLEVGIQEACTPLFLIPLNLYYLNVLFDVEIIIMHKMVYTYLQQHNLLSVYQSGFCSLHSTNTCLADVTNTLLKNIDNGQLTGLVFLDLKKAFDTLDHRLLLDKLTALGFNRN